MKKIAILMAAGFGLFIAHNAYTSTSGAPSGNTGSPQSSGTCARSGCHNGPSAGSEMVTIQTDIPTGGFDESTDYTVTITATGPSTKKGFQASVEDPTGHVGTITPSNPTNTQVNGDYITHTAAGTANSSWQFTWNSGTAPDQTTIYAVVNFSDNSSSPAGDVIVTEQLTLDKSSIGLMEIEKSLYSVYPNPASHMLNIASEKAIEGPLEIRALDGRKIREIPVNEAGVFHLEISLDGLNSGNYIVKDQAQLRVPFKKS